MRNKLPIARPDTIRRALECEAAKKFSARGVNGVKAYGSASEFDSQRDRCVEKLKKLYGGS